MFLACDKGEIEIVSLLLKEQAINVNAQTGKGETVVYKAAQKGWENILTLLLAFPGVDINAQEFSEGISYP